MQKKIKIIACLVFFLIKSCISDNLKEPIQLANKEKINTYAINFIWINKNFNPTQTTIFPEKHRNQSKEELIKRIKSWSASHPKAKVFLWYDSELSSQEAIIQTKKIFSQSQMLY